MKEITRILHKGIIKNKRSKKKKRNRRKKRKERIQTLIH
jgi:hypothetical protein